LAIFLSVLSNLPPPIAGTYIVGTPECRERDGNLSASGAIEQRCPCDAAFLH